MRLLALPLESVRALGASVLILILLEVRLLGFPKRVKGNYLNVLILILLEVRLLEIDGQKQEVVKTVLILILLEVRLLVNPEFAHRELLVSLNPYSAGSETVRGSITNQPEAAITCLNPYSAGSETVSPKKATSKQKDPNES